MAQDQPKDPRNYFAAERTFLAWIRTGLAMMGFGFVVARFGLFLMQTAAITHNPAVKSYGFSIWAGIALVLLGVAVNFTAALTHLHRIRNFNRGVEFLGRPSYTGIVVAVLLALVGAAMVVFLISVE